MASLARVNFWAKKRSWVAVFLLLGLAWLAFVAAGIWRVGSQDFAVPADCIIVLGAAVKGEKPSPVFAERLRHGVSLYEKGLAPRIIFTGGVGEGLGHSEGAIGEQFALAQNVPALALLKETKSRTTRENLQEAQKVMAAHGLEDAIIVSDPLHLRRAGLMAKGLGMRATTSPTASTRYRSWRTQLPFLLREVYFVHHYYIFSK